MRSPLTPIFVLAFVSMLAVSTRADEAALPPRLAGFDAYMEKVLVDWNLPGAAVGVVVKDQLVFAKGYGYRDLDRKLPATPNTLFQIASNTKLFTTVACGLLVEEGKLDWDVPVRRYVPSLHFSNDQLDNSITLRDMLAHRTGVSRHDLIWYKSDFTRQELFDRLRYLEPSQPLRQGFLYNNMMYAGAGQVVQVVTGKTWEDFVRERIFQPLDMRSSMFSVREMETRPDHGVPYDERRDTRTLYRIPFYEEAQGIGPAGSIVSNVRDLSHWLIALMNDGRYEGRQVVPPSVLRASLEPTIALPNSGLENRGYREMLNSVYGMGRWSASYRGHFLAFHGGDLPGFHSQVSCMPYDSIGVIVFVIGDHAAPLYNVITFSLYERLLGLDLTPWSERRLQDRLEQKTASRQGRKKAGADRVPNTSPSHPLADYVGDYESPVYGVIHIGLERRGLAFRFHHIAMPLSHYHYDRFDSPDDEQDGLWSFNFGTSPQGEIDRLTTSLDETQTTFVRKVDSSLSDPKVLAQYVGKYKLGGSVVDVGVVEGLLFLLIPGTPRIQLVPYRPRVFRLKEFADQSAEFVAEGGRVVAFTSIDPSGEYRYQRVK